MAKTLKDIAEKLNLSVSTVSCALKDGPKVVSPEVRKKVRRAAKELGYRPNRIAKSLATGRTRAVGIVPMYMDADTLLHPYLQLALNGIFNAAHELEHDVLVFTAHDHNHPKAVAEDLLDSRADGLIFISPMANSPAVRSVAESGVPYAVLFEASAGNSFTVDNELGVTLALEHLVGLGHRRIAHIAGDLTLTDGQYRYEAYHRFMQDRLPGAPEQVFFAGDFTRRSGLAIAREVAQSDPRPTAVFCANDDLAFGFMEALPACGVRCPLDISVVGFDGVYAMGTSIPTLTTVCQKAQWMAAEAVRALIRRIETGSEIASRVFEPDFVVRDSSAPVPQEETP